LNKATMNIPSEFRIASIAPNHALILPHDANPGRMQFSERTGLRRRQIPGRTPFARKLMSRMSLPCTTKTAAIGDRDCCRCLSFDDRRSSGGRCYRCT
jgi:hypothetical protein